MGNGKPHDLWFCPTSPLLNPNRATHRPPLLARSDPAQPGPGPFWPGPVNP